MLYADPPEQPVMSIIPRTDARQAQKRHPVPARIGQRHESMFFTVFSHGRQLYANPVSDKPPGPSLAVEWKSGHGLETSPHGTMLMGAKVPRQGGGT